MIQIAWILCDKQGNRIETYHCIIKHENFRIPIESSRVHGISTERANNEGEDLEEVFVRFEELVGKSNFIVAHNISFNYKLEQAFNSTILINRDFLGCWGSW